MNKLSHKALKDMGKNLGGYELSKGDIYYYENNLYYLRHLQNIENDSIPVTKDLVNNVITDIKKRFPNAKYVSEQQIAYSHGVYGNTGQLHKCRVLDNGWNEIGIIYTYV